MGKFNRGDFGGNKRGGFGAPNKGGFKNNNWNKERGGEKKMFSAICNECKNHCEVPFRPSGDKPVYCNNCFRREENTDTSRDYRKPFGNNNFRQNDKKSFNRGFEKRSFEKPVSRDQDGLKVQLSEISSKLDRLITAVEGMNTRVISEKKDTIKKAEVEKESKAKASKKETSKKSIKKVVKQNKK